MSSDKPITTLKEIAITNGSNSDKYSVLVYYINKDKIDPERPKDPLGLVIPCGQFDTQQEADALRNKISVETNATYVATCKNNSPIPIGPYDVNTITYNKDLDADIATIEKSLVEAEKRFEGIEKRKEVEVAEREDPTTVSYLIQELYKVSNANKMKQLFLKQMELAQKIIDESECKVLEFVVNDPASISSWESDSRERFLERGELGVHKDICKVFNNIITPEVKSSVLARAGKPSKIIPRGPC